MKMKVLIRSLVLLAGLAAWTADTAWGQSSSRHSSSRGGTPVRQAAAQQRGEDDAVETVDLGDKKRVNGKAWLTPRKCPRKRRRSRTAWIPCP